MAKVTLNTFYMMKVIFKDGGICKVQDVAHAQRLYNSHGAVPTEDSNIVLDGDTIKMAKRKTTKKKEDSAE